MSEDPCLAAGRTAPSQLWTMPAGAAQISRRFSTLWQLAEDHHFQQEFCFQVFPRVSFCLPNTQEHLGSRLEFVSVGNSAALEVGGDAHMGPLSSFHPEPSPASAELGRSHTFGKALCESCGSEEVGMR